MGQDVRSPRGPRCIALVGPFQSGKTTLLEAILARTGAIPKEPAASMPEHPERRSKSRGPQSQDERGPFRRHHHLHGRQLHLHRLSRFGRVTHDMRAALPAVNAAIVVCEADEKKLPQLQIILRELEELGIPPGSCSSTRSTSANKRIRETLGDPAAGLARAAGAAANSDLERRIDRGFCRSGAGTRLHLSRAQAVGSRCARRRQSRPREGSPLLDAGEACRSRRRADGAVAGRYPAAAQAVADDLARELREGLICPVLLGAATRENGVLRLLKALRHEAPALPETAKRLGAASAEGGAGLRPQDRPPSARRQTVADAAVVRPSC